MIEVSIELIFINEAHQQCKSQAKVQYNNGNVSLSLFPKPTDGRSSVSHFVSPECVYQLNGFTMIEISETNRLSVKLRGPKAHCELLFVKEADVWKFFDCLSQVVALRPSSYNPFAFLMEGLLSGLDPSAKFVCTILPPVKSAERVSLSDIQKYGIVFEVTEEKETDENVADKWKALLKPEEKMKIYKQVKGQWKSTTERQWANSGELRAVVELLEKDLAKHEHLFDCFEKKEEVMRIAFNVLLTETVDDWDNGMYFPGLVVFIIPFLHAFVDTNESMEDIEELVFGCFSTFFDQNHIADFIRCSSRVLMRNLFVKVGQTLEEKFPVLLHFMYQKRAFSLDFFKRDLTQWFFYCFSIEDISKLWMECVSYGNSEEFLEDFIIAWLFSMTRDFIHLMPLTTGEFVKKYESIKQHMKLSVLLENRKVVSKARHESQVSITTET